MSYSLYFFAVDCGAFRQIVADDTQLVTKTLSHIKKSASPSDRDLALLKSLLVDGVSGNWPVEASPDTFTAFCWLLEVTSEPIVIGSLRGFRRWDYWADAQLWPYFQQAPPPFAVPTSHDAIPATGFLSSIVMPDVLSSADAAAEGMHAQNVQAVRTEVFDILESLYKDKLDLFAIAMES